MKHRAQEICEALVDVVVVPAVMELCAEARCCLRLCVVIQGPDIDYRKLFHVGDDVDRVCNGEVRVLLGKTVSLDRASFRAEGIFPDMSPETGFSGFLLRGSVFPTDHSARISARSNRYNVWTWAKEFEEMVDCGKAPTGN